MSQNGKGKLQVAGELAQSIGSSHQDAGEKAVTVSVKATELSAKLLLPLFKWVLNRAQAINSNGAVSMQALNAGGKKLEQVSLNSEDLKAVQKTLKKQGVDFSVFKDKSAGDFQLFFKAQNRDQIFKALESCVKNGIGRKTPMKEQLENAQKKADDRNKARAAEKEKTAERAKQKGVER